MACACIEITCERKKNGGPRLLRSVLAQKNMLPLWYRFDVRFCAKMFVTDPAPKPRYRRKNPTINSVCLLYTSDAADE